jgi:DNA polymerase-3 subunit beta
MHIRVKRDILKEKLKKVIKFCENGIQGKDLLKADSDKFQIFSIDSQTFIIMPVDAEVKKNGFVYIDGERLLSIVEELRYDDLEIFVENDKLFLKGDKGKSKINIELSTKNTEAIVSEFSEINDSDLVEIEPTVISDIFRKTKDIPDILAPRIVFGGVFLEFKNDLLVGVATDGKKMVIVQKSTNDFLKGNKVIVPIEFVKTVLKDLEETNSLKIGFKEDMLWFAVDEFTVATRIIDEKFPEYEAVIPKAYSYGFQVNKDELTSVIKEGLSISDREIVFSIKQDTIDIIAETPDVGKLVDVIDIEPVGQIKEEKICLNGEYLLDILSGIDSEKVNIFYISPETPIKILIPDDNNYLSLLMPIKI